MATPYLGLRGTGDWVTNQRPESWREAILFLYPNGDAPLTAMMAKIKSEKVTDPTFHWFTKSLPSQSATVTGRYIDSSLTTAYVYASHQATVGIAGGTVFLKMALADVKQFRTGHIVLLRDASRYGVDLRGKVTTAVQNAASSYIAVKLLEADDNDTAAATYNISTVDTALIIGTANPEGGERPEGINYDVTELSNYTQIFRNSIEMTRTAELTRLRTGDALKEARREALEMHSIEMEKAFLFGISSLNTGINGKPERTTMGLIPMIKQYAAANAMDYTSDATYTGKTWLESGETWFETALEQIFRYGKDQKVAFCGSGALLGIQRLAKNTGQIFLNPKEAAYGIQVVEWVTPFGVLYLKRHPLFSYEATTRNSMVILEPDQLTYKYVTDTTFKEDKTWQEGGGTGLDGRNEEYITEAGLEFHHPLKFGYLNGVGQDA